ncbi:MAG TPA: hypothetical protein VGS10_09230 [Terracidiphilus sp.]|nr:hypothetical protein [Terracidiphilus sp.]
MNSPNHIPSTNGPGARGTADAALRDLDATLHLLAKLPVPAGLEDRIFATALRSPRKARILEWPRPLYARDWVRGIAAAALVIAVGGGGWGIYAHVQPNEPARVVVAPQPMFHPGGFSSAEMIRRPQTLNGPVVKKAEPSSPNTIETANITTAKKATRTAAAHKQQVVKIQPSQSGLRVAK